MARVNPALETPEDIAWDLIRDLQNLAARVQKADEKDLFNNFVAFPRSAKALRDQVNRILLKVAKVA